MQTFLLTILAISLTANLIQAHLLHRKKSLTEKISETTLKQKREFMLILAGIVAEAIGSRRMDDVNVRLFAYKRPYHEKAIKLLAEEGMVEEFVSGDRYSSAVIQFRGRDGKS